MGGENRAQGRQSLGQVQCGEASPLLLIWHGEGAEPPGVNWRVWNVAGLEHLAQ